MELEQDRKWVVEHHSGNREIVIERTDPRHAVYIFNCHNSVIQVGAAAPLGPPEGRGASGAGGSTAAGVCVCRSSGGSSARRWPPPLPRRARPLAPNPPPPDPPDPRQGQRREHRRLQAHGRRV
jgi:hypothetical protein